MGNVQGYGSFAAGNNNNNNANASKKMSEDEKAKREFKRLLEQKKLELYKLLEIYNYHIKVGILEQSFKIKNQELIKQLDNELKTQTMEIKKLDEKYQRSVKELKKNTRDLDYKKNINEILFYIALLCFIGLIGVIIWAISKRT
jgi:hypothetical protein